METIFVSIASYCDPELQSTILSLLYHSNKIENLSISVAWQGKFDSISQSLNLYEIKSILNKNFESNQYEKQKNNISLSAKKESKVFLDFNYNSSSKPKMEPKIPFWASNFYNNGMIDYINFLEVDTATKDMNKFGIKKIVQLSVLNISLKTDNQLFIEENISDFNNHSSYLRIICIDYNLNRGPCFARYLSQRLYKNEKYFLQIDSHMRFTPNWDLYLIKEYYISSTMTTFNPILTTYPPDYDETVDFFQELERELPVILTASHFDKHGLLHIKGRKLSNFQNSPIPCFFWASGFSFSLGKLIKDVPYDKDLQYIFFGEEQSMWIRLFTHGYDFFCPSQTIVFHHWKRKKPNLLFDFHTNNYSKNKTENNNFQITNNILLFSEDQIQLNAKTKIKKILINSNNMDNLSKINLGIGTIRSPLEFWNRCQVDIYARKISTIAFKGSLIENLQFLYDNISSLHAFAIFKKWSIDSDI